MRERRAQWAGRCSNPRLLVFSQVLHRLSYRPQQKKPGVFCDTGLLQKSRYFDGRVSQAPVAHGEGIRRLTGKIPRAFLFANVTRPQGHHSWHLLLKATAPPLGASVCHCNNGRDRTSEGSQEFSRSLQMIRRSNGSIYSRPLRKKSAGPFSRRFRPYRIQAPHRRTGRPPRSGRRPSPTRCRRSPTARLATE